MFGKKKSGNAKIPQLNLPLKDAAEKISLQIDTGLELQNEKIGTDKKLHAVETRFNQWNNENFNLLKKIFNFKSIAQEYSSSNISVESFLTTGLGLTEKIGKLQKRISGKCEKLVSIKSSLDLFSPTETAQKIYFLHSSESEFATEVCEFLKQEKYDVLMLKQFAQAGSTIFDTLQNSDKVERAVIMLNHESATSNYPDQNLLLELGIFVGLLGRENVFAIRVPDTILPQDYHGFDYIESDDDWKKILKGKLE